MEIGKECAYLIMIICFAFIIVGIFYVGYNEQCLINDCNCSSEAIKEPNSDDKSFFLPLDTKDILQCDKAFGFVTLFNDSENEGLIYCERMESQK